MEYASKGVANAGLVTGIIGTTLSALEGVGGVAGLLGTGRTEADRPVTRYEMSLIKEAMAKDQEITLLKSQQYTDHAVMGIQGQISAQNAWNAAQGVNIQNIQEQLRQVVKPFVPTYAVVAPAFPAPNPLFPYPGIPPIPAPATASTGSSDTSSTGSGN